jgi:hypothetical protein
MSTESDVIRTDDPAGGDIFATRDKASGAKTQGMHLDPEVQGDLLSSYETGGTAEKVAADIASGAGRLFRADVILLDTVTADRYLHVFDALTATGLPVRRAFIPAGGQASLDLGVYGRVFSTGITLAISSTLVTYTAVAGNEGVFQAAYF